MNLKTGETDWNMEKYVYGYHVCASDNICESQSPQMRHLSGNCDRDKETEGI